MGICNQIFPMKKEKIKSRNYNIASNVLILFVFFFTLFSFGKNVEAITVYGQNSNSSGTHSNPSNSHALIGSFTLSSPAEFGIMSDWSIYTKNTSGFASCNSGMYIDIDDDNVWGNAQTYSGGFNITPDFDNSGNFINYTSSLYRNWTSATSTFPAGTYYVWTHTQCNPGNFDVQTDGSGVIFGYITDTGGYVPPPTNSRIDTFTYATSTQTVNITGYWNVPSDPFVSEQLEFYQESTALGRESFVSVSATTTGAFNFTFPYKILPTPGGATTTAPILETIYFHAKLYSVDSNYYDPFGLGGLDTSLYKTLLDSASATLTELTHDLDLPIGLLEYPEYECAITSITGCLKNAGIWLFYPSSQKIDQFKSLSSDLQTKFPFAYAYGVNQMRQELFSASSTPQTISLTFKIIPGHGTSTLELISQSKLSAVPYANTVKTILGWILWLLAIEYIYYRVIRAHDPNTPS